MNINAMDRHGAERLLCELALDLDRLEHLDLNSLADYEVVDVILTREAYRRDIDALEAFVDHRLAG